MTNKAMWTIVLRTDYYVWSKNIDIVSENTILFPPKVQGY